jgi:hypothetical protein
MEMIAERLTELREFLEVVEPDSETTQAVRNAEVTVRARCVDSAVPDESQGEVSPM